MKYVSKALAGLVGLLLLVGCGQAPLPLEPTDNNTGLSHNLPILDVETLTVQLESTQTAIVTIHTPDYDTQKYRVEYELSDQNRKVLRAGTAVTGTPFTIEVQPESLRNGLRVKLRLKDNSNNVSSWGRSGSWEPAEPSTSGLQEQEQRLRETSWGLKTATSINDLAEATTHVFHATALPDWMNKAYSCIQLNSGTVQQGQLLTPQILQEFGGLVLFYEITNPNTNPLKATVTYYWCAVE